MNILRIALAPIFALAAFAQNPAPPVPPGVKAHRDVSYVDNGHARQKLDLYLPEKAEAPLPVIIWIHGGGWAAGSKNGCPPLRQGFVERGYAVASIGYRLSSDAIFPAQIQDCKAGVRWLRAHAKEYGIDPERFGVWGSSAGGHLVALLGTSGEVKDFDVGPHLDVSSRVQAVCDFYGPTDFERFVTTPGFESHAGAGSPESRLLGGVVMENKEKASRLNPITYVDKADPPFLIVHGDKDSTVPINQSEALFEVLKKVGVSAHFHTIKGAGHGLGFAGKNIDEMVSGFFDARLKNKSTEAVALVTDSVASVSVPPRGSGAARTGTPGRRGLPWEAIAGRDDKNKDGKVAKDEFSGPAPIFERLDRNKDGVLTKEEHEALVAPQSAPPQPASPTSQPAPPQPSAAPVLPKPAAPTAAGKKFELKGDRWTYRDGEFVMSGILLKPEGKGPFPAVLISHGMGGNAQGFGMQKAREMVGWGLVCIAPDYAHAGAGGDRAKYGASEENLRRARTCLEILRTMPEVDGKRLAAYGHSMGGFVTVGFAGTVPDALKAAAITGSGIAPKDGYPAPSPTVAGKIRTPFLILHGGNDTTVRPEQSAALKEVLDKNKVANERAVYDGEGHPIDQTKRSEVFARTRQWFTAQGVLTAAK
jgi:acetyl esterase/lipase